MPIYPSLVTAALANIAGQRTKPQTRGSVCMALVHLKLRYTTVKPLHSMRLCDGVEPSRRLLVHFRSARLTLYTVSPIVLCAWRDALSPFPRVGLCHPDLRR